MESCHAWGLYRAACQDTEVQTGRFRKAPRIIMMLRKFSSSSDDTVMRFLRIIRLSVPLRRTHACDPRISFRICRPNSCINTSSGSAWNHVERCAICIYLSGTMTIHTRSRVHVAGAGFSERLSNPGRGPGRFPGPKQPTSQHCHSWKYHSHKGQKQPSLHMRQPRGASRRACSR